MKIGEVARAARVSTKTVRYYEELGLITSERAANGYRDFDAQALARLREIRVLSAAGISPSRTGPFLQCLDAGHEHSDDCVSSLAEYRRTITELDTAIEALSARRSELQRRLELGARRGFTGERVPYDPLTLPEGLPVPADDGRAEHLAGLRLPELELPTSDGGSIALGELGSGRTIIYLYPLTGRPGVDLPQGWNEIPGARGCTTEACGFRDHHEQLRDAGAERVFGLSSQDTGYQREVAQRLRLPFSMISDERFELAAALDLPTFAATGYPRLYARLTLVVRNGRIEHVFYPIFPPNQHAGQVLAWLRQHPMGEGREPRPAAISPRA